MFKALLRTRLKAFLQFYSGAGRAGAKRKKPSAASGILKGLLVLYVLGCFIFLFFALFQQLADAFIPVGLSWLYFTMAGIMAFAVMFIGSVFTAKAQLFEAKDNELLLAMPVPPSMILGSRMLVLMLFNLLFGLAVMIPVTAAWLLTAAPGQGSLVAIVLMTLGLSLFSMGITTLAAWAISLLTARMRNKNLFTLLFSVLFLGAYFVVIGRMNTYITQLAASGQFLAGKLGAVAPLVWLGKAMAEGDVLSLLLSLLIQLAVFALSYYLVSRCFIRIVTTKRGLSKVKYEEKSLKVSDPAKALLRRETRRLTASANYMLNSGLSVLFCAAGAVAVFVMKDQILNFLAFTGLYGLEVTAVIDAVICMVASMFTFSAASVSLEGKQIWIARSLPVPTADILLAKRLLHQRIAVVSTLVLAVAAAVALDLENLFLAILLPVWYAQLTASVGLVENLRHPKLDWTNEVYAYKQGWALLFAMLLNWALVLAPAALYIILLARTVKIELYLYGVLVFYVLLDVLLVRWIKTRGVKRFEELN